MARKGILASDPSFAKMNITQWWFEYYALQEKEKEEINHQTTLIKLARLMVVRMFGLDLMLDKQSIGNEAIEDPKYLPLIMYLANPDMLKTIYEKHENADLERKVNEDSEFEKMSAALASGDVGDMDPVFSIPPELIQSQKQAHDIEYLKSIGVQVIDGDLPTNSPQVKFDAAEAQRKRMRAEIERKQTKDMLDKQLAAETQQGISHIGDNRHKG